ncbi:MAG: GspH/FimT family protein [Halioglobus sp.]
MARKPGWNNSCGVTLVELLVVLALMGVALVITSEPLRALRDKNHQSVQVARFLESLKLARAEAVMRNLPVSICPSRMFASGVPDCGGPYRHGWIVFANEDRDRAIDADVDRVLRAFEGLPPGFTLMNRDGDEEVAQVISYLPDGSSRNNQTLVFCPPPGSTS